MNNATISEETPLATPQEAATDRNSPEDFGTTISVLEGANRLLTGEAVAEIEIWERKLEASSDPELQSPGTWAPCEPSSRPTSSTPKRSGRCS